MKKELIYIFIFIFSFSFVNANIVINEVMYNPTQSESYNEWVEIYNKNNESINLTNWNLCNNKLLSGYINNNTNNLYLNTTMILESNQYAIITDGRSGTGVYYNFNVSNNSIALHVDAASLCGELGNGGDNITVKNSSGYVIDSFNYTKTMGADGNGMSLCKLNNTWQECNPTPGLDNTEWIVGNYNVDRVIDGDTLVLGNGEHVRLIGIDTPEIGEFYYGEAKNRLRELVEGKNITLERDVENIDRYDRLLRYVYVNNTFINLVLVEEGYAEAYPYYPNLKYEEEFTEAEERARNLELGIWKTIPEINNLKVYANESYAMINFTSNELVNYSLTYNNFSLSYSNFSNNFSINLFNLNSNTTYYYNLSVCDLFNNCNLYNNNFTTSGIIVNNVNNANNNQQNNNNGPGGGSSSPYTYAININELSSLSLARDDKAEFVFNGEGHSLKINNIYTDYVIMTISSTPQEITVSLGEIKNVDLNLDGEDDIYVKVNGITYNSADIEIKKIIKEEVVEETKPVPKETKEESKNETASGNLITGAVTGEIKANPVTGGIIIVSIVIIGLILYFILRKRK